MNLTEWRKSRKLTLTKAAEVLDVSQPSLSRIEAGKQWPDLKTIDKIIKNSGGKITAREMCEAVRSAARAQ